MLPNRWQKKNQINFHNFRKHGKILNCLLLVFAITSFTWIYSISTVTKANERPLKIVDEIKYFMTNTIIEPSHNICANNPYFVLLVETNVRFKEKRTLLRELLPNQLWNSAEFVRIFMVGAAPVASHMTQLRIEHENREYGDILQGSFEDHYKNSTYKTLMGLHWVTKACATASYVIKSISTTDIKETLVFLRHLDDLNKHQLLVGHRVVKSVPVRDPEKSNDPAYVKWEEYGGLFFPPYLSGRIYVTTPQVAERLTDEAPNHKYLFLEDVFVTGILTQALHIHIKDFSEIQGSQIQIDDV